MLLELTNDERHRNIENELAKHRLSEIETNTWPNYHYVEKVQHLANAPPFATSNNEENTRARAIVKSRSFPEKGSPRSWKIQRRFSSPKAREEIQPIVENDTVFSLFFFSFSFKLKEISFEISFITAVPVGCNCGGSKTINFTR